MTNRKPLLTSAALFASTLTLTISTSAFAAPLGFGTVVPATEVQVDDGVATVVAGADIPLTVTATAQHGSVVFIEKDGAIMAVWGTDGQFTAGELTPTKKTLAAGNLVALAVENGEDEVGFAPAIFGGDGDAHGIWISGR